MNDPQTVLMTLGLVMLPVLFFCAGYMSGRRSYGKELPWIIRDLQNRSVNAERLLALQTRRAELAEQQLRLLGGK